MINIVIGIANVDVEHGPRITGTATMDSIGGPKSVTAVIDGKTGRITKTEGVTRGE